MKQANFIDVGARQIGEDEPVTSMMRPPIFISAPSDPTPEQRMRIVEVSGTLDFWDNPEEDIYSPNDGELV